MERNEHKPPRVAMVTGFPRHQRIEVYNEVARLSEVNLKVFYLQRMAHGRHWDYGPEFRHDHVITPELRLHRQIYLNPTFLARYLSFQPDLTIVCGHYAPAMQITMYLETARRRPWVFYSEIPGVRFGDTPFGSNEVIRSRIRSLLLVPVSRYPTEIWAIGTRAQEAFREIAEKKIPVINIPYFADLSRFVAAGERRERSDRLRFLFSGSLSFRKGADVVASAVAKLVELGYDFEMHVAGAGPLENDFRSLPSSSREKVKLYGFLQLEEIAEVYTNGDVLLFPSRHDGWGMTLGEGMAAGMPAISTDQTGSAVDMIQESHNGFRLHELELEGLVSRMRWFLDNRDQVETMGAAAQETTKAYTHLVGAKLLVDSIHRVTQRSYQ